MKEKRNELYAFIYDNILNKKLEKKEWYKLRDEFSKLLKEYESMFSEVKTVEKVVEKIIYKEKPKTKKGYWDI